MNNRLTTVLALTLFLAPACVPNDPDEPAISRGDFCAEFSTAVCMLMQACDLVSPGDTERVLCATDLLNDCCVADDSCAEPDRTQQELDACVSDILYTPECNNWYETAPNCFYVE